jgi:DNA uptake protein ComE-like DNA-binding protein
MVLWVMIVLTLLGTSFFHLSSLDIQSSRNDLEKFQAELLADSAIHLAMSVLEKDSELGYHDLNSVWSGLENDFESVEFGAGLFRIYSDDLSEEGGTRYGLRDESSKLNLNTATKEMLEKLPGMTSEMAASIVDWRDSDDSETAGGAEREYYNNLDNPYDPRNAPFQSVAELLQVKGFSPRILYGEDANRDGVLQTAEDDGAESDPPDNGDGKLDRGLLPYLSAFSYERNVNAEGEKRVNLNTANNRVLRQRLEGKVSAENLRILIRYRRNKKFENLGQLLTGEGIDKTEKEKAEGGRERTDSNRRNRSESRPGSRSQAETATAQEGQAEDREPSVASEAIADTTHEGAILTFDEFRLAVDELTLEDEETVAGRVNINTAPKEVLASLPGMTDPLAERIVERRSSDIGSFETIADLATVEAMSRETFAGLLPYVSVRSTVFEALAVGYLPGSQAFASVEAYIDWGASGSKIRYYRVIR